ncbi:unnamed protein product [Pedinophyceae sp. YPF-701]|nr:unnamed protein product [Pedinophyceae sp. YPF-701]
MCDDPNSFETWQAEAGSLADAFDALSQRALQLEVHGAFRIRSKCLREARALAALLDAAERMQDDRARAGLLAERVAGARNNLAGLEAEIRAVELCPDPAWVGGTVRLDGPDAPDGEGARAIEVDAAVRGGSVWVEIKGTQKFDVTSSSWTGASRHVKGLRSQAQLLFAAAAMPRNWVRYRAPEVAFVFADGAHESVRRELERMGAAVIDGMPASRSAMDAALPGAPPRPATTVLDVTTLCALVSEVSNGGVVDRLAEVRAWAAGNVHRTACVDAELEAPLLPSLASAVQRDLLGPASAPGADVVAPRSVVERFEGLVEAFAGPSERARWARLRARVGEVDPRSLPECARCVGGSAGGAGWEGAVVAGARAATGSGEAGDVGTWGALEVALAVRGLAVTANGKGVAAVRAAGAPIEAHVHRTVWLTGL